MFHWAAISMRSHERAPEEEQEKGAGDCFDANADADDADAENRHDDDKDDDVKASAAAEGDKCVVPIALALEGIVAKGDCDGIFEHGDENVDEGSSCAANTQDHTSAAAARAGPENTAKGTETRARIRSW